MPATISLYHQAGDLVISKPEHSTENLGAWLDANDFCSEELSTILTAFGEGRLYHGGGGASAEWAVKLYEPFDEGLDPWSDEFPEDAMINEPRSRESVR